MHLTLSPVHQRRLLGLNTNGAALGLHPHDNGGSDHPGHRGHAKHDD